MKRLLYFFLIFFTVSNFNAQLDREHWFAPMSARANTGDNVQRIYMSTDETTPFPVRIYNNNVVIATVMISKGNPQFYEISNRELIITTTYTNLFKPVSKGIYLNGDKPFYASLRFSIYQHGELLTSKGTSAIGTEFYTAMAPITVNNSILNFMTSVMATEDNTQVTITGFNPNVRFSDNITRTQINFTLNKGQSYIIDGTGTFSQNWTGFIGAKITATKPVSVTNGNFNGQYAGNFSNSSDILMDQGVPTNKLGTDFVLMKGNGPTSSNMERAMIIATQDGTQVFLNNNATAVATLNAGQYYLTPNTAYINQGSNHYNMFVRTSKNAYVYQLLAGADNSNVEATGGFNYIPPLSCYLPKKIDEIGMIDHNRVNTADGGWLTSIPTKLNIITERNATVTVQRNGANLPLNAANGPFNVSGNNAWVTYSIPNITGNVAVYSSHAVTAGISAGNYAVGYGGYFAGFSYTPAIIKQEGECVPNVVLSVTEGFNSYLWVWKVGGVYVPAPGVNNQNTYVPSQAGIYAVQIQQGSCPQIQTEDFKFFNCTTYTSYNYSACSSVTITPQFVLSSQNINAATVQITVPPTNGTAVVNADGTITFTANANVTGATDVFRYSFCGTGSIPDCETAQATISINQIIKQDAVLSQCTTSGSATFDLTTANVTADPNVTKVFYLSQNGAETQNAAEVIPNFTAFPATTGTTSVWVRITNAAGCAAVAKIDLIVQSSPVILANQYTVKHCDEDIDGIIDGTYKVQLSTITPIVFPGATGYTINYYRNSSDANNQTNPVTGIFTFTGNTSVWIRVDGNNGCPSAIAEIPLQIGAKASITSPINENVCEVDGNGSETVNLSDYTSQFTSATGAAATYYNSLTDAQNNQNAIDSSQTLTGNATFYYRISVPDFCSNIGVLNLSLKTGTASTTLAPSYTICENSTTTLNVGSGFVSHVWSTGATTQTITVGPGNYWVDLTNSSGCVYRQNVEVIGEEAAQLNISAFSGAQCDTNFDGSIDVTFSTDVTPVILSNYQNYTVRYYTTQAAANAGGNNNLPDSWTYTANTTLYVRVEGTYCPFQTAPIQFTIGTPVPLSTTAAQTTVCDTNLNGSENVNLANFNILFTASATSVRYFNSLADARNNVNTITANQTINTDRTFFYRFSATGSCDNIGQLSILFRNPTPSTTLAASYTVCETNSVTLNAGSGYTSYLWSNGATTQTVTVPAGNYWVDLTNSSGCVYRQNVSVLEESSAVLNIANFNGYKCDEDFDGIINIKFSTDVTPVILANAQNFTVRYYTSQAFADAGGNNNLPDSWTYSTNTTLYVRVDGNVCPYQTAPINFGFGNKVPLLVSSYNSEVCDDDQDGTKSIDLSVYKNNFTSDNAISVKYFSTLADAQQNVNALTNPVSVTGTQTYYLRFSKNGLCTEIATLTVKVKIPRSSEVLVDIDICPQSTTILDAGPGFDSYSWSTGETTQTIEVAPGEYWVDLGFDGCIYRQNVTVGTVDLPVITAIEIQGTTVTVQVTGGNPPYRYSLDGINYQDSNVFTNVQYGQNTVYVISADNCTPVTQTFTIIRLLNVITPNGDGYNDVLDYSDLLSKEDVVLKIYDRYGKQVFEGTKANEYSWDGKLGGRLVETASYWFVLQYRDPGAANITQHSSWVMVKNRD